MNTLLRTLLPFALLFCTTVSTAQQIVRVSQLPGVQADSDCHSPSINDAGTLVAFVSGATSLSPADSNDAEDIFLRNMVNNALARVSVSPSTGLANGHSAAPTLLGDGSTMTYLSLASNLIPGDTNNARDLFRRVNGDGSTQRMSLTSAGAQLSSGSFGPGAHGGNPSFVLFHSRAPELPGASGNLFLASLRNIHAQTTIRLSFAPDGGPPTSDVVPHALSADGTLIALISNAPLVPGNNSLNRSQLYLRDRLT